MWHAPRGGWCNVDGGIGVGSVDGVGGCVN